MLAAKKLAALTLLMALGAFGTVLEEIPAPGGKGMPFKIRVAPTPEDNLIQLKLNAPRSWAKDDRICLLSVTEMVACGRLLGVGKRIAWFKALRQQRPFRPNDRLVAQIYETWPAELLPYFQEQPHNWRLGSFRLNTLLGYQRSTIFGFFGEFSWTPELRLDDSIGLKINLGAGLLQKVFGGYFTLLDYQLLLSIRETKVLDVDVGGGAMTWINYGGTAPQLSLFFTWRLGSDFPQSKSFFFDYLSRLVFGYSAVLDKPVVHFLKVGVGFTL